MPTIDQTQRSTNLLLACDESCIKLFNDERVSCLHVADGTNKQFWRIVHPVISNRRLLRRERSPDKVPWRPLRLIYRVAGLKKKKKKKTSNIVFVFLNLISSARPALAFLRPHPRPAADLPLAGVASDSGEDRLPYRYPCPPSRRLLLPRCRVPPPLAPPNRRPPPPGRRRHSRRPRRPQHRTTAGLAAAAGHPSIPAGNGTPPQPGNPNP